MQFSSNRSMSNPPLKELNSTALTQKVPSGLNTTFEATRAHRSIKSRGLQELDKSFDINEKKLGGIEGDRSVLINRINKLQQEVDTLNRENSEMHSKLHSEKARLEDFQKKLGHAAKVKNLVDKNFQGDLKYEREENSRLKHILHTLELERNELRAKVKELEAVNSQASFEKQEVLTRLQQKIDHFNIIEGDNRVLVDKISLLQGRIGMLERENFQVLNESERVKAVMQSLERENLEVITRVQEECVRYNNFVVAKNDELGNIKWAFKRQLKVQAAITVASGLKKFSQKQVIMGLYAIKTASEAAAKKVWALRKVYANFRRYSERRVKEFFERMAEGMSWIDSSKVNQRFLQRFYSKKLLIKMLSHWRKFKTLEIQINGKKSKAARKVQRLFGDYVRNSLENRLGLWKNMSFLKDKRMKVMLKLIRSYKRSSVAIRFGFWKTLALKLKMLQSCEDLSVDFASKLVQGKFFLAFREYCRLKKASRQFSLRLADQAERFYKASIFSQLKRNTSAYRRKVLSLKAVLQRIQQKETNSGFQGWKQLVKAEQNSWKMERMMMHAKAKSFEATEKTIFYAWKAAFLNEKYNRTQKELLFERPARIQLEVHLEELSQEQKTLLQKSAIKCLLNPMYLKLKQSFIHWKKVLLRFNGSLKGIKNLIYKHYYLKIFTTFNKWREINSQFSLLSLSYKNNRTLQEKIELDQELLLLSKELQSKSATIESAKRSMFKKCCFIIKNREILSAFRNWSQKSLILYNKSHSATSLTTFLSKLIKKNSFNKIRKFSLESKEKQIRRRKLCKTFLTRCKDLLSLTFDGWKAYSRTLKNFRKAIRLSYARKNMGNLILAVGEWKVFVNLCRLTEISSEASKLYSKNLSLEEKLLSLTGQLEGQSNQNERLHQVLMQKGKKRLILSFFKGNQNKLRQFFNKWRQVLEKFNLMQKKTVKIMNAWRNKEVRAGWRAWMAQTKAKSQKILVLRMEKQKKDHKAFANEAKKAKNDMVVEIQMKEEEINAISMEMQKYNKVADFVMRKTAKSAEVEYTINKTAYYFSLMKERFYKIKAGLSGLSQNIRKINIRRGLKDIKTHYLESLKIASLRNMLINVFKRYGIRFLRNEFDRWNRNVWFCSEVRIKKSLKDESAKVAIANSRQNVLKSKNTEKLMRILMGKSKSLIFTEWRKAANALRSSKNSSQQFLKFSKTLRLRFSLRTLSQSQHTKHQHRLKILKSLNLSSSNLQKLYFSQWKQLHLKGKSLKQSLSHLFHLFTHSQLSSAFSLIKSESVLNQLNRSWLSKTQQNLIRRLIQQDYLKLLKSSLIKWRESKDFKISSQVKFKKAVLRALHRKLRSGFLLWNEEILLKDTVDITNTQGPVAIENGILRSRIEILNKLIEEEGLNAKYIEKYVLEKENLQQALALQAIHTNKYKSGLVNPKDRMIVPKFFLTWKKWLLKRKQIAKSSHRTLAYLRKGELMKGFLKWKHGLSLIINTVNKLPRREMFSLIAKMDMDIKFLETKLESTHKSLIYFQTYSNLLNSQVRRGQNMALTACSLEQHKTLYQVMLRWSSYAGLCKVHELLEQLTSTEQNLYILKTTLKSIEDDNQILIEENMELRQASLDGVAIAEAFETLSKERERLSLDLADRAATIKRLIDQNNELADRLRIAGLEDAPEREVLKSKRYN